MFDTVLELAVPARVQQVGALRRAADAFLQESTEEHVRYTLLLVVSELCTNAIEALHDGTAKLTLRVQDLAHSVVIEVEDCGPGFAAAFGRAGSSDDSERGRGLTVVQSLVDEFAVERSEGCTLVRCTVKK